MNTQSEIRGRHRHREMSISDMVQPIEKVKLLPAPEDVLEDILAGRWKDVEQTYAFRNESGLWEVLPVTFSTLDNGPITFAEGDGASTMILTRHVYDEKTGEYTGFREELVYLVPDAVVNVDDGSAEVTTKDGDVITSKEGTDEVMYEYNTTTGDFETTEDIISTPEAVEKKIESVLTQFEHQIETGEIHPAGVTEVKTVKTEGNSATPETSAKVREPLWSRALKGKFPRIRVVK